MLLLCLDWNDKRFIQKQIKFFCFITLLGGDQTCPYWRQILLTALKLTSIGTFFNAIEAIELEHLWKDNIEKLLVLKSLKSKHWHLPSKTIDLYWYWGEKFSNFNVFSIIQKWNNCLSFIRFVFLNCTFTLQNIVLGTNMMNVDDGKLTYGN